MDEPLANGDQLVFRSFGKVGALPTPEAVWSSATAAPIRLKLLYFAAGRFPSRPIRGQVIYSLPSAPTAVGYKVVFETGDQKQAVVTLTPGMGTSLRGDIGNSNSIALIHAFGIAKHVTAVVYAGDQRIAQTTFELASDQVEAGLDAFSKRAQSADPGVCRTGPPLPMPPFAG